MPPYEAIGDMIDYPSMIAELTRDEGCRITVYDDATGQAIRPGSHVIGHPTIGIGRCLDNTGISTTEAETMAATDIAVYCLQLGRYDWWMRLDAVRRRAIVNMRHQLGLAGLLEFRSMIAALTLNEYATARTAAMNSQWGRDFPARAYRVSLQLMSGKAPDPSTGKV